MVPLLVTDPAALGLRSTVDIDAIVEVTTTSEWIIINEKLREMGFKEDSSSPVICRWNKGKYIFDLIPSKPEILGFSNLWYEPSCRNSITINLGGMDLRIISAPYFIATKIEAFQGRGNNDYMSSTDLEDIITVVDGRPEILAEIETVEDNLKVYLASELKTLLDTNEFLEAIPGFLNPDPGSQARRPLLEDRLAQIGKLG